MARKIKGAKKKFSKSRNILDYRPNIPYEEPPQVEVEPPKGGEPPSTIAEELKQTQDLIDSYRDIETLADAAQARLDQRADGLVVQLDPIVDKHVIDAMKRRFPDRDDPAKITFQDYRDCLQCMSDDVASRLESVNPDSLQAVMGNLEKTDFLGLGLPPGMNRPELQKTGQIISAPDLDALQKSQLKELFEMMKPDITGLIKDIAGTGGVF